MCIRDRWSSFDGGWQAPRSGFGTTLGFLEVEAEERDSDFRVLWLGHPDVVPGDGWRLTEELSYLTTVNGSPSLTERWPSAETGADAQLGQAVLAGRDDRAGRMGEALAEFGVEYVVVVEANAPVPRSTVERPPPAWLGDSLGQQLDLVELRINDAVQVYRNEAATGFDLSEQRSVGIAAAAGIGLQSVLQWSQIGLWLIGSAIGIPMWVRRRRQSLLAIARGEDWAVAPDWYRDRADADADTVIDLRDAGHGVSSGSVEPAGEIDLRPHEIRGGTSRSQRQAAGGASVGAGDAARPDDGPPEVSS